MFHKALWHAVFKFFRPPPAIISVCKAEQNFIKYFRLGRKINQTIIPNGIDFSRIKIRSRSSHIPFRFLTFAGRLIDKRTDLIIKALLLLEDNCKLIIVAGDNIANAVNALIYNILSSTTRHIHTTATTHSHNINDKIEIIPPTENISALYENADCFISASAYETFSYSVAEATVSLLPVIQSNIEGTRWNSGNPSTFEFESLNVESLASAMRRVMRSDKTLLAKNCQITANNNRRRLSLESWAGNVIDFFNHIE